jgi:hypothetical protein
MLKYVLGFSLVLGLAVYVAIQDEHAAQTATQEAQQPSKSAISAVPDTNHTQQNVPHTEWNLPSCYGFFRWPNGTTTWAIILTLMAIAEQTKETAKATKAVRDSIPLQKATADAALLNAKAVINAERPWVLVEDQWQKTHGLEGIVFYAINKGDTPAEIVEAYFEREILPYIPDNLPSPPLYKSAILIPKRGDNLLVKGETWELNPVPIHPESWIANSMKRDVVENAREFVYFYGVIVYRDMLHESTDEAGLHYTRFCFVYESFLKVLLPSGPQEYRQKK